MYGNYQHSLTGKQQSAIQIYLRMLPAEYRDNPMWQLLHDLTYAESWTPEPQFKTNDIDAKMPWDDVAETAFNELKDLAGEKEERY
jgi:hypothetical protein